MSAFDKVIGYETIKTELIQICDMIHNRTVYEKLGAKMPRGVLLHGDPGLGKSLMVKCLIEESGLKANTLRRVKGGNGFVEKITNTFKFAKEKVYLCDDGCQHKNAQQVLMVTVLAVIGLGASITDFNLSIKYALTI